MIKTLADQYLAQNAGRRYPFKDDTELPGWLPDTGVLDFRCTVQGMPAGTAVEARLVKAEHTADRQALFTVALTAGGVLLDELVFVVPENAADGAPYTAYASGSRSHGALTVTSAAVPPSNATGLPYDAEIEYLESTGTQYIDTGVVGGSDSKVEIVASSDNTTKNSCLLGARNSAYKNSFCIWQSTTNAQVRYDYSDASQDTQIGNEYWDIAEKNTIVKNKNVNTLNGVEGKNNLIRSFVCEYPFYLFGVNTGGAFAVGTGYIGAIHSCKIYANNTLVRDFIPVLDNDLVPCMYDKVSGEFFYNQGTGEFVRGDDLPAAVYTLDIPFATTTIVCDSLKVHSIQSAHDLADARDEDDPAGLDTTAAVDGEIALAEGRNAEPYLDGNRLRLDVFKGAGLGERCQSAVSGSQRCGTVLFTINGERPGSDGNIRIVGDGGITVVPDPENHAVEIRMDDEAASRMADGCAPACPTYTDNTTVETNDTEEAE